MAVTTAKQKHTHKFKRLKYKTGTTIFFCALPDCTVKMNPALCLGKRSICWICGSEFILDEYTLRLAKPHCAACHKPKNKPADDLADLDNNGQLDTKRIVTFDKSLEERMAELMHSPQAQDEEL